MANRKQTQPRNLTISIVSHGHDVWLLPLLDDLAKAEPNPIEQVILTHNLPPSQHWKQHTHSRNWPFKLHELINERPLGFGANHNHAFSIQHSDCFAVFNPDLANIPADLCSILVNHTKGERTGLTFPQLLNLDGSLQDNQRPLVTPWSLVQRHLLNRESTHRDWVSGACMVFSSVAFKSLGGFDDGYHLYCEDVDLCIRMKLAGWKVSGPHGSTTHAAQRNSQVNMKSLRLHVSSLLRLWTRDYFWRFWLNRDQFR